MNEKVNFSYIVDHVFRLASFSHLLDDVLQSKRFFDQPLVVLFVLDRAGHRVVQSFIAGLDERQDDLRIRNNFGKRFAI